MIDRIDWTDLLPEPSAEAPARGEVIHHCVTPGCADCGAFSRPDRLGVEILGPLPGESRLCDVCGHTLRAERNGGIYLGPPIGLDVGGRAVVAHVACAIEGIARAGEDMTQMAASGDLEVDTWAERWAVAWEVTHG